jgi:hypothetical protein
MGNNGVNFTDPSGGSVFGDIAAAIGTATRENIVGTVIGAIGGLASMAAANGGLGNLTPGQFITGFVGGAILGNLVQGYGINITDMVGLGFDLVNNIPNGQHSTNNFIERNITLNITVNVDVIDPKNDFASGDEQIAKSTLQNISGSYVYEITENRKKIKVNILVNFKVNFRTLYKLESADDSHNIMYMVEDIPGSAIGQANMPGTVGVVERNIRGSNAKGKVMAHELGHNFGFSHVDKTAMHPSTEYDTQGFSTSWDYQSKWELFRSFSGGSAGNKTIDNWSSSNNNAKQEMKDFFKRTWN